MALSFEEIPELRLGHKIFISHSGVDKNLGRLLAKELKHRWYHPFLDEQSLPKGMEVSMQNILVEAQSCELALFILTPDFFTRTRNPMMEVIACVESKVRLLPLFYKLTVDQVKQSKECFEKKWIELNSNANDHRPQHQDIGSWRKAFTKLIGYNGVEYGKHSTNESDFADEVVDEVYKILPPEKRRDDAHVVGKERLVEIVEHMFNVSASILHGIKVLGLHGMVGIGKTTLCQALSNFYLSEFCDRVCHVQLHEGSRRDRINSILLQLGSRNDDHSKMSETEAQNHLERTMSVAKFFLVVDDIQDSSASDKEEIKHLFLNKHKNVPAGSKLLFLAQRSGILGNVLSSLPQWSDGFIHPFPGLILDEAKLILRKEVPFLFSENGLDDPQQIDFLNQCTELCTPTSGSAVYNPLMLKLLASFLIEKWSNVKAPQVHREDLPTFTGLKKYLTALKRNRSRGMKELFDKLQANFNSLPKEYVDLFLDLALFVPGEDVVSKQLCLRRDREAVEEILEKLQSAAFLSDDYSMLDVYKELAKRIASESSEMFYAEQRELKGTDLFHLVRRTWTRVAFVNCTFGMVMAELDLSRCDNIQVLLLDGNKDLTSVVMSSKNSMQSVAIRSVNGPVHVFKGNKEITSFDMAWENSMPNADHKERITPFQNHFSIFKFLAILELGGTETHFWEFDTANLDDCKFLEIVQLYNIKLLKMGEWKVPCWPYLRELKLSHVRNLQVLSGLEQLSNLEKLRLSRLESLTSLADIQLLGKLTAFVLHGCKRVFELRLPSSLWQCTLDKCDALSKVDFFVDIEDEMDTTDESETESSENGRERNFTIEHCGNLREVNGRPADLVIVGKSAVELLQGSGMHTHGLPLDEGRRSAFVPNLGSS